jgi:hypothetical protein
MIKGHKHSLESKQKISDGIKKHLPSTSFKKGSTPWNKDIQTGIVTEGVFKKGSKNRRWKGGTRLYHTAKARALYYKSHKIVVCDECGSKKQINIHHKDENWKNNNIKNLQPLCASCHTKHHRAKRKLHDKSF